MNPNPPDRCARQLERCHSRDTLGRTLISDAHGGYSAPRALPVGAWRRRHEDSTERRFSRGDAFACGRPSAARRLWECGLPGWGVSGVLGLAWDVAEGLTVVVCVCLFRPWG